MRVTKILEQIIKLTELLKHMSPGHTPKEKKKKKKKKK